MRGGGGAVKDDAVVMNGGESRIVKRWLENFGSVLLHTMTRGRQ